MISNLGTVPLGELILGGSGSGSEPPPTPGSGPPMVLVPARPPTALAVLVATPDGSFQRWGSDEPSAENQPQSLEISTAMPGGFETMTCTLQRDPRQSWHDLQELSEVQVFGLGGSSVAWEGRMEQLPDTGGSQAQVSPVCSGWQSHLDDNSGAMTIYIDQLLSNWQGPGLNRQIALINAGFQIGSQSVGTDAGGSPALILENDGAWATILPVAEAWYDGGPCQVASVYWQNSPNTLTNSAWVLKAFMSSVGISTGEAATLGWDTSGVYTPATTFPFTGLQMEYTTSDHGAENAQYQTYWNVAVVGDHGLNVQGTWPAAIGLLASDVVAHAVQTWAPKLTFTMGANGTIQPSTFVIPQLLFNTPGTSSTIIKQAIQYELLDWAVWEGPTFYLNPRNESVKTRNWSACVGDCQLEETGPNVTRIWNGVFVQYTAIDGTTQVVGPPGSGTPTTSSDLLDPDPSNPATLAGLDRWTTLQLGTSTAAAAIQVGGIFLQEQKLVDTSGQASLVGHVRDSSGTYWPAWMVRAGDTLTVVDSSDTSARRIVSTSYDDPSKTNTVQLDQPPDSVTALMERMSEVISGLGLS